MRRLTNIRPGEGRNTWAAFAALFILIASHSVLETARDALFLADIPATNLPWVYLAIAAVSLVVTQLQARIGGRFGLGALLWRARVSGRFRLAVSFGLRLRSRCSGPGCRRIQIRADVEKAFDRHCA